MFRLQTFLDEQETLSSFSQKYVKGKEGHPAASNSSSSSNCLQRLRANIWETINYTRPSVAGKVNKKYSLFTFLNERKL